MLLRLLFIVFMLQANVSFAAYYLMYLKDKGPAPTIQLSKQNKLRHQKMNLCFDEKDQQVYAPYCNLIEAEKLQIIGKSKWLNAVLVQTEMALKICELPYPFILKIEALKPNQSVTLETKSGNYAPKLSSLPQLEMLQIDKLHAMGYNGKGRTISVFDNGFTGVDKLQAYEHLYMENRIANTKNFVDPNRTVYEMGSDGEHGSRVFSTMAALLPPTFTGAAYGATFNLAVTEDMTQEGILEEWNWLMAAEWADSLGTDIISSSLGYSANFTYGTNHKYEDMDGRTTIVSQAANYAASRGILVVNSAGNEAETPWRYIVAPADADSCLAVGAVDIYGYYASFSSEGPSYDGRTKPDIVAMGQQTVTLLPTGLLKAGNGTSFACPLIAGLAACLWQVDTSLSNMDLFYLIKKSGFNSIFPDNYEGWGIPGTDSIYYWLTGNDLLPADKEEKNGLLYPNPCSGNTTLVLNNTQNDISAQIKIYDTYGKLVYNDKINLLNGNQHYQLKLAGLFLPNGMYFLHLEDAFHSIILKNKLMILE